MPELQPDLAIESMLAAPYLTRSEENMETAYLTEDDQTLKVINLDIGATERVHAFCLATVLKDSVEALQICVTEQISLPAREKGESLGFGVVPTTSATSACTCFESEIT